MTASTMGELDFASDYEYFVKLMADELEKLSLVLQDKDIPPLNKHGIISHRLGNLQTYAASARDITHAWEEYKNYNKPADDVRGE